MKEKRKVSETEMVSTSLASTKAVDAFLTGGAVAPLASTVSVRGNSLVPGWKPGDVVCGRYEVRRLLGTGGMGAVFQVLDPLRDCDLALKWLPVGSEPSLQQRWVREIRLLEMLHHERVIRTLDLGMDASSQALFFTMEYLSWGSLEDTLQGATSKVPGPTLSMAVLQRILNDLFSAVAYAHGKGVIHRDLKPNNILWDKDEHIKLIDFGIAKQLQQVVTHHTSYVGTAYYMAPEQLKGGEVTPATDVYALGVLVYQLLTGELFYGRMPGPLEFLEQGGQPLALPDELDQVVLRALEASPSRRFGTVASLQEALFPLLFGASVSSLSVSSSVPVVERSSRSASSQMTEGVSTSDATFRADVAFRKSVDSTEHSRSYRTALSVNSCSGVEESPMDSRQGEMKNTESDSDEVVVDLSGPTTTDTSLAALRGRDDITHLNLAGAQISNAGLAVLSGLSALRELNLERTNVSEDGLTFFPNVPKLRVLRLTQTQVGQLNALDWGEVSLHTLTLGQTPLVWLGDDGRARWLRELRTLDLHETGIQDSALLALKRLPRLEQLSLAKTRVTDHSWRFLTQLTRLRGLILSSTAMSDTGLRYLGALGSLRYLALEKTNVSAEGCRWICQVLPHCQIVG